MKTVKKVYCHEELDKIIAENMMGNFCIEGFNPSYVPYLPVPKYSTDISAAWKVWERLIEIHKANLENYSEGWRAELTYDYLPTIVERDGKYGVDFVMAGHDNYPRPEFFGTLPLAICLKAIGMLFGAYNASYDARYNIITLEYDVV